jgi:hypothetical protein
MVADLVAFVQHGANFRPLGLKYLDHLFQHLVFLLRDAEHFPVSVARLKVYADVEARPAAQEESDERDQGRSHGKNPGGCPKVVCGFEKIEITLSDYALILVVRTLPIDFSRFMNKTDE